MKAIIAAGGTGGHINPAIAIADEIMKNEPDSEIIFVGREDGMEKNAAEKAGYRFHHIEIHGFYRGKSLNDFIQNIRAVYCSASGLRKARKLIREFDPDLVLGCGGYVSGPVVLAAELMGRNTAIQEQNSFPGVTTRLLARKVDRIFAPSKEAAERLARPDKTVITGNPIRDGFDSADREAARERLGVGDRICVISFGGSLGASAINKIASSLAAKHHATGKIFQIHATGRYGTELFPKLLKEKGVDPEDPNIEIREYIDNMQDCLAAADLVISRAGAISISEITASGTASVLIPSPNVAENHQYYNAKAVADADAALLIEEKDMDPDASADEILALAKDADRLRRMGENARKISHPEATREIYRQIRKLIESR